MSECLGKWLEQNLGCTVAGYAKDGPEGFDLCMECKPDLALIDIQIPKMDGLSLVKELLVALPKTRFIVMSGLMDPYTIWRVSQLGVHGYIVKSEKLAVLLEGIRTVIDGGLFFSETFQEVKKSWLSKPEAFQKILSDREQEVLRHLVAGWSDERMATKLGISEATVGVHRKNIRKKLDMHSDRELLEYARIWGLDTATIEPERD